MSNLKHNADIIIAGASVRSLAQAAVKVGLRPICIDLFRDADLQQLILDAGLPADNVRLMPSFQQVEDSLADIDPTIPLVPVGGMESSDSELDRLRAIRPVFTMPSHIVAELRNPEFIFPVLKAAGFPVLEFHCGHQNSRSQISPLLHKHDRNTQNLPSNWLKKNWLSSGGQSVQRIRDDQLLQVIGDLKPSEYLQQEVDGVPCSATFLACEDASFILLGCAIQICGEEALNANGFQYCGNAGPLKLSDSVHQQLNEIVASLQQRWPLTGVFGIDFIWKANKIFVIEINPRLTASHEIHETSNIKDAPHILKHCSAFQPDAFADPTSSATTISPKRLRCRFILYSDHTFVLSGEQQRQLMSLRQRAEDFNQEFWLSDIPPATTAVMAGAPFCSINLAVETLEDLPSCWIRIQSEVAESLKPVETVLITSMIGKLQNQMREILSVQD